MKGPTNMGEHIKVIRFK